jgi:hypothetical protein
MTDVKNVWCIAGHDANGIFILTHIVATVFAGQTSDGIASALVGNPYDKFLGGSVCLEGICYGIL